MVGGEGAEVTYLHSGLHFKHRLCFCFILFLETAYKIGENLCQLKHIPKLS